MPAFLAAFASQDALKTRGNEGDFSGMREYSTWCYILQGGKQARRGRRYLIRETNNAGPFYCGKGWIDRARHGLAALERFAPALGAATWLDAKGSGKSLR